MLSKRVFDVQKYGITIQFTDKVTEAEAAFKLSTPGGVKMYSLDTATGKKFLVKVKDR